MEAHVITRDHLAKLLDGRAYGDEITKPEEDSAKKAGLVVVFGYSDDNVELRGAVHDEIGAYGGADLGFTRSGLVFNKCSEEDCPYFEIERRGSTSVEAKWCKKDTASWTFETAIPHSIFNIFEDGEVFCRGIVFLLSDVP